MSSYSLSSSAYPPSAAEGGACPYCHQTLPEASAPPTVCPHCKARLQPLSLIPMVQACTRLGARLMDVFLFEALISLLILPLLALDTDNVALRIYLKVSVLLGLFTLMPFIEAACLSQWGTTPGKWLMKIEVVAPGNGQITFKQALLRTAWLNHYTGYFGIGLALVAALFLAMNSKLLYSNSLLLVAVAIATGLHGFLFKHYNKSQGHTPWDERLGLRVQHRVLRFERLMMAVMTYFLLQMATHALGRWPAISTQNLPIL
jgi:uncharacterized RDD family membrane protein YckC